MTAHSNKIQSVNRAHLITAYCALNGAVSCGQYELQLKALGHMVTMMDEIIMRRKFIPKVYGERVTRPSQSATESSSHRHIVWF